MSKEKVYHQYLGFRKDQDGQLVDLQISGVRFSLIKKNETGESTDEDSSDVKKKKFAESQNSSGLSNEFHRLIIRFIDSMSAFKPMIALTTTLFDAVFAQTVLKDIYDKATDHFDLLEEDNFEKIYGVPIERFEETKFELKKAIEFKSASKIIPSSTLLSLVATFDSYISEIITLLLKHRPELISDGESKISIKDLLKMGSFDEAKSKIVQQRVENLMRGSHLDQVHYFDKNFKTNISQYEKLPNFFEIFERRNLAAHGSCIVNDIYLNNSKKLGYSSNDLAIGDTLPLSQDYLENSANIIIEFGILLIFSLWKHNCKDDIETIYMRISDVTYTFIKLSNYKLAADILSFCIKSQSSNVSDIRKKMMTINLANAYKKMGQDEKCNTVLKSMDWSATTEDFKMCVASLEGNLGELIRNMDINVHSKRISKDHFRQWPVFDWVNNDERFRNKYLSLYGEEYTEMLEGEQTS